MSDLVRIGEILGYMALGCITLISLILSRIEPVFFYFFVGSYFYFFYGLALKGE